MNTTSLTALGIGIAAEGLLWAVAPGLATIVGIIVALFIVASCREGIRTRHPLASAKFNVEDFQRRLAA
jgi:hypothetical protein